MGWPPTGVEVRVGLCSNNRRPSARSDQDSALQFAFQSSAWPAPAQSKAVSEPFCHPVGPGTLNSQPNPNGRSMVAADNLPAIKSSRAGGH